MKLIQASARADILKALGHPIRVLIVEALSAGERCVCELNGLAEIDKSGISRHLAILKRAGIVSDRRTGMKVFYKLETPCILKTLDCAVEVIRANLRRGVFMQDAV
jgi:ArsR family transcriptional regulator